MRWGDLFRLSGGLPDSWVRTGLPKLPTSPACRARYLAWLTGHDGAMGLALPELVRAYAERCLGGELRPVSPVRLQQAGEMGLKRGAKPRVFTATEEFAVDRVAFVWRARFPYSDHSQCG